MVMVGGDSVCDMRVIVCVYASGTHLAARAHLARGMHADAQHVVRVLHVEALLPRATLQRLHQHDNRCSGEYDLHASIVRDVVANVLQVDAARVNSGDDTVTRHSRITRPATLFAQKRKEV